jgi:hypothetical protein
MLNVKFKAKFKDNFTANFKTKVLITYSRKNFKSLLERYCLTLNYNILKYKAEN